MKARAWTTLHDIRTRLLRLWNNGRLLGAPAEVEALFPWRMRISGPDSREVSAAFGEVQDWIRRLREAVSALNEPGLELQWKQVRHPIHGRNALPSTVLVHDAATACRLIGKHDAVRLWRELVEQSRRELPQVLPWLDANALRALEHADDWPRLLAVARYFLSDPRPGRYIRELDIPSVDSKFIESRRGLIAELLDQVLAPGHVDASATGVRQFERRFGLRAKPALIRFRVLDPDLAARLGGLDDVSVPVESFAALRLRPQQVFVTENDVNGLSFPAMERGLVIFGLGYGVESLAGADWLNTVDLHYWGDIDTHGFAILDRMRAHHAHTRSFLMDRETLEAHWQLRGEEPYAKRFVGALARLNTPERHLFDELRTPGGKLEGVRLEQERIAMGWVVQALARLQGACPARALDDAGER